MSTKRMGNRQSNGSAPPKRRSYRQSQASASCQSHGNIPTPVGEPLVGRAPPPAPAPAPAAATPAVAASAPETVSPASEQPPPDALHGSPPAVSQPLEPLAITGLSAAQLRETGTLSIATPPPADVCEVPPAVPLPPEPLASAEAIIDLTGEDVDEAGVALDSATGGSATPASSTACADEEPQEDGQEVVCSVCGEAGRSQNAQQDWYSCKHSVSVCFCCSTCSWRHTTAALQGVEPLNLSARHPRGPGISCPVPGCQGLMADSSVAYFAPEEYNAWAARLSEAVLDTLQFIRCPNPSCGVPIERLPASSMPAGLQPTGCPEIDRTGPQLEIGPTGVAMSREAMLHKWEHRYRCAICGNDFCDTCMVSPYHLGLTCEEHAAPRCALCSETPLPEFTHSLAEAVSLQTKDLHRAIVANGRMDVSWCIERSDYETVYVRMKSVCSKDDCQTHLARACTRSLPCGHPCAGIREEVDCLGCLQCAEAPPCQTKDSDPAAEFQEGAIVYYVKGSHREMAMIQKLDRSLDPPSYTVTLESGAERETEASHLETVPSDSAPEELTCPGDGACAMCHERLLSAPAIRLSHCGHVFHLHCCEQRLRSGCPGPNLSFGYLACPLCRQEDGSSTGNCQVSTKPVHLDHPALSEELKAHLALQESVIAQCKNRIRAIGRRDIPELLPGGKWDGRPVDYALEHFLFYQCHRCHKAYYGGERECGAAIEAEGGREWKKEDLLCPGCSSNDSGLCPQHGTEYIEWKCRYCCSVATWCCFGGIHMCNSCHKRYTTQGGWGTSWQPNRCGGPHECPLRVKHAPNGSEHCLGCALCRRT